MDTYFSLLNLEPVFALDKERLESAWREASSRVHPDRFATASATEKRIAMQWAARINQAYETLKSPVKRAAYLCDLAGQPIDAESNTRMAPEFLMKQMQWREQLDDARQNPTALQALAEQITAEQQALENCLSVLLDQKKETTLAAEKVRQLMFVAKLQQEIKAAIAA